MTTTTNPVDLDRVLLVADELRRLCKRAVKAGVRYPVFKQESGRPPSPTSRTFTRGETPASGATARSTACWPTARARHGVGSTWNPSKLSGCSTDGGRDEMEPQDVDAIAARTQARELAWARNESGDAVAVDVDVDRYILAADGATLFIVRPHLGGISRCVESWVRSVLAGPVGRVVTPYVPQDPPNRVKRSRRRTARRKGGKATPPVVEEEAPPSSVGTGQMEMFPERVRRGDPA